MKLPGGLALSADMDVAISALIASSACPLICRRMTQPVPFRGCAGRQARLGHAWRALTGCEICFTSIHAGIWALQRKSRMEYLTPIPISEENSMPLVRIDLPQSHRCRYGAKDWRDSQQGHD